MKSVKLDWSVGLLMALILSGCAVSSTAISTALVGPTQPLATPTPGVTEVTQITPTVLRRRPLEQRGWLLD
jgi:hypothetical protein